MKHLICEHLKNKTENRGNVLKLQKDGERALACEECYYAKGAVFFIVSESYFKILTEEIAALARRVDLETAN